MTGRGNPLATIALPARPRIAILGAGALGSVHGARLAQAGADVVLVDIWTEHVLAINDRGLTCDFVDGLTDTSATSVVLYIPAVTEIAEAGKFDLAVVLATTLAIDAVAHTAATILAPNGCALSLQNGYGNVEALTAALGGERVIGGASYTAAQILGPGHVVQQRSGRTVLGELDGSITPRIQSIADWFAAAQLGPEISDNIRGLLWTKLLLNCSINAISASTGLRHGDIVSTPAIAELQDAIISEVIAVAEAKNVTFTVEEPHAYVRAFCAARYSKPSMLQHVEGARCTEIDALNGAIVAEAARLGIDAPYNRAVTAIIKGIERGFSRRGASEADFAALEWSTSRESEHA